MKLSERMKIMATKKRFRTPAIWTILGDYAEEVAYLEDKVEDAYIQGVVDYCRRESLVRADIDVPNDLLTGDG